MQISGNLFRKSLLTPIFLICLNTMLFGQQKVITGSVKDSKGEPVIGATVIGKGTTIGTTTNVEGKFSLSVDATINTLVISFIGMKPQDVEITGSTLDVVLEDDNVALDELVVIGYATAKKRELTGSVSSIQGQTLANIPVSTTTEALTGRMAGVQVTTTDGAPDAEIIVRVRGGGSITGSNAPLYIIDGFPASNMNDISPADIQSIDILKDASSTAIYGSQGSNGVVIITTKQAKGGKTTVTYQNYVQIKQLAKRLDVLNPYDYVLSRYEYAALGGEDAISSFETKFGVYDDIDLYKYVKGKDWQGDLFGSNQISQFHNVNVNGGTDKTKFSLSTSYNKDQGLIETNRYSRLNNNFKIDHEISKNLRLTLNARLTDSKVDGAGTSGGLYKVRTSQVITSPAVNGLMDFTEVDPTTLTDEEYAEYISNQYSLTDQAKQYWQKKLDKNYNFTTGLDWNIFKGLKYRLEGGYQYTFGEQRNYFGERTTNVTYEPLGLPFVTWIKSYTTKMRMANVLTYKFELGNDHKFDVLAGQELNNNTYEQNNLKATGFNINLTPDRIFANLGLGDGTPSISSSESPNDRLSSFFGRFNYNYKERYLLTLTFRADGSSKFAPGHQWGYFPAAAAAWRISQEPFMQPFSTVLSNLKLRVSYGTSGNNRIASTMYKLDYKIDNAKSPGMADIVNYYYRATNSQMSNPDLKWETTVTQNIGLDFGLFKDRLSGTVEGYWNTTKDLLVSRKIVAPGYTEIQQNIGQTSNKGFELTLNGVIINKKDFTLNASFNFGLNRSNVDKLTDENQMMEYQSGWASTDSKGPYDYQVRVGYPVGLMIGWVNDGYYTTDDFSGYTYDTQGEINGYVLKPGVVDPKGLYGGLAGLRPGVMKLKDLDGNGIIDINDRQIIGKADPKFIGGFGLNSTYKGFDMSIMFNYVYGNSIYNANKIASAQEYRVTNSNLIGFMSPNNRYYYIDDQGELVWDLAKLAEMNEGANAKEYWTPWTMGRTSVLPTSWAIEDASFLRLQNVTLGYTLPKKLTLKAKCSQLRVYCTMNNVWVWTNYTGYDPEVSSPVRNSSTSNLTPGVDYSSFPKSFSWTFGMNLTF